jgi:hypothetical protein
MKKRLLILVATGLCAFANAQSNQPSKEYHTTLVHVSKVMKHVNQSENIAPPVQPFYSQSIDKKNTDRAKGGLSKQSVNVKVGGSYNTNSVRATGCTQVDYNAALGAIFYTHRADFTKFSAIGSGAYELSYSLDNGATWDSSFVVYKNQPTRFPSGIVYNPVGNTNIKHAYWAYNGSWIGQSTTAYDTYANTDSIALGSSRLDSTSMVEGYKGNGKAGNLIEDGYAQYMSIGDDSVIHSIDNGTTVTPGALTSATTGAYQMYLGAVLNTGTFSGGKYNWTQSLIKPHLMPNDHVSTEIDTLGESLNEPGTAWSQDGKTGYVVIFGNLDSVDAVSGENLNFVSYQPIVYVTTNSGATWTMTKPHNFRNDPMLNQCPNFHPTADSANVMLPIWRLFNATSDIQDYHDFDLVVDKKNNLHIFGAIEPSAMANRDSSEFLSYYPHWSYVCDVSTTPTGVWTTRYIDTVNDAMAIVNDGTDWTQTTGTNASNVAFGARIQASRTLDGSKVFCTWVNDVVSGIDSIEFPDIFGQAMDVTTGNMTAVKQFTNSFDNFEIEVGDYPIVAGTSPVTYTIPCTKVQTPGAPNDGSKPIEYLYTNAVMYADTDFKPLGIPQIVENQFSISQNYPNPFNNLTSFNLNLIREGAVSVDVFNMVGQKMESINPGKMGAGSHIITINGSGLATGVYFYRVTVDGTCLTQKMIVE